ncbi:MAG: hypothetical protein HYZ28_12415 [Myxococcales bacterium]|nr:hypothetical protein [Myxococcales bacterium]
MTLSAVAFILWTAAQAASKEAPAGPGDACLSCHEKLAKGTVVHPPVKNGLCLGCHEPASDKQHAFGFRAEGKQMCRQCHAPRDTQKVLHNPVTEGLCLFCHDPHSSDHHVRLRKNIFDTCTQCHPSKRIQDRTSLTRHGALDPERNKLVCVACHDPHQSDHPKRLKDWPPMNVCFTCHDKPQETQDGEVMNMKAWVDSHEKLELRHGPVREGLCNECHEPHGTDNWRILKRPFPPEFYWPYRQDLTYALCFGCHDQRLIESEKIAEKAANNEDPAKDLAWGKRPEGDRLIRIGVTGFRNGEENLHFKHANKVDKGRTCRDCHDFHASPNVKHIRDSTRFGNWEYRLNYQRTVSGGSCWPGCHVERRYDRVAKKENPR